MKTYYKIYSNKHPRLVTLRCHCPEFRWHTFHKHYKFYLTSTSLTKMLYKYPIALDGPNCPRCLLPMYYLIPNQEPYREDKVLKEMNQC